MLKLFTSAVIIVFSVLLGYSQTTEQKVEEFLGSQRYSELQSLNSSLIDYLKVRVEEGYVVSQSVNEKKDSYVQINHVYFKKSEISIDEFLIALDDESRFNILNYSFPNQDSGSTIHYLLGDSETLLTVFSNAVINKKVASAQ